MFRLSLVLILFAAQARAASFSVVEEKGAWWFKSPDGSKMLSLGVDCVGPGPKASEVKEGLPEYSAEQLGMGYEQWRAKAYARMKSWGFNSLGGWFDPPLKEAELPFTPVLHLQATMGSIWWDLWDYDYEGQAAKLAAANVAPYKGNPRLIGYFLDNELAWADEHLLTIALGWGAKSPGKQRMTGVFKELYKGDFAAFQADFETGAKGWDGLAAVTSTVRRDGRGHAAIDAWTYQIARRYYEVLCAAVRKEDPGKLILGDRFRQFYPQAVARAARGLLDVISTNYESTDVDGWVSPNYFQTMHELSALPILVGEYYATARQNRSGLRNSGDAFTLCDTQEQRAKAGAAQARAFAAMPWVLGWHWFQFYDEPTYGRGDGEDYNMGLVDIYDEPYLEFTEALKAENALAASRHKALPVADLDGRVEAPRRAGLLADGKLGDWDKSKALHRGLIACDNGLLPFGDFFLGWNEEGFWVAARPYDFSFPGRQAPLPHDESTWGELARLKLRVEGKRPYEFYGAAGFVKNTKDGCDDKKVHFTRPPQRGRMQAASSVHLDPWHSEWEVGIPAAELGYAKLKAGTRLSLDLEFRNRGDFEVMRAQKLDVVLR